MRVGLYLQKADGFPSFQPTRGIRGRPELPQRARAETRPSTDFGAFNASQNASHWGVWNIGDHMCHVCVLFQWLLVWMLSWTSGQLMTWCRLRIESNHVTVERSFCRPEASAARQIRRDLTPAWLRDQPGCDKAGKQHRPLLHLHNADSRHVSSWSVANWTTPRLGRVPLCVPLRCRWKTLHQETHLAAIWLRTMFGFLQFCTRLENDSITNYLTNFYRNWGSQRVKLLIVNDQCAAVIESMTFSLRWRKTVVLVLVVLLLCVFFAFMFSLFSLLLYVFIDVRLSHLNKDYLLTYLVTKYVQNVHLVDKIVCTLYSLLSWLWTSSSTA